MPIEEVVPGTTGDPFTSAASGDPAAVSPNGGVAGTAAPEGPGGADPATVTTPVVDSAVTAATAEGTTVDPDELTEEEQAALDLYAQRYAEEIVLPKVQSSYDRRIAAAEARAAQLATAAQQREQALLAEAREAKLNGLTDDEKARLRSTWQLEDQQRALDAYNQELEGYHRDLLVSTYVARFDHLELTPEDFADFQTPEQMEMFVTIADREYWKAVAEAARANPQAAPVAAAAPAPAPTAPAGASAPSDTAGGGAAPELPTFNPKPGREAMLANIGSGWEDVRIVR